MSRTNNSLKFEISYFPLAQISCTAWLTHCQRKEKDWKRQLFEKEKKRIRCYRWQTMKNSCYCPNCVGLMPDVSYIQYIWCKENDAKKKTCADHCLHFILTYCLFVMTVGEEVCRVDDALFVWLLLPRCPLSWLFLPSSQPWCTLIESSISAWYMLSQ